jgi:hypothetical protein
MVGISRINKTEWGTQMPSISFSLIYLLEADHGFDSNLLFTNTKTKINVG